MAKLYRPQVTHLSNGIPVILQHYDGTAAASYWWIRSGSTDEGRGEEGFAHFLEHMLFKDAAAKETGRASTGQMALAIETLGGDVNAYTSFDQTVYHVTCAATHWERVLDVWAPIAKPQRFLKEDFEREREVILEELRKGKDSPSRLLFERLFETVFLQHPYGRPVIGFEKTLKRAKLAELESYYKRNYVSSKMGLILVGPLEGEEHQDRKARILKMAEKHFGKRILSERAAEKPVTSRALRSRTELGVEFCPFDVQTPTLSFALQTPGFGHPDLPALDLAASVLGSGELSRLYQRLFYQDAIATDASGGLYVPHDAGMLYFQAELDSVEKFPQALQAMTEEIRRLREEGPTEEELARVLVNAESEKLYATQTADGLAGRLGFMQFTVADPSYDHAYLEDLRQVDADEVKRVLREHLDPSKISLVALLPKAAKEPDAKVLKKILNDQLQKPAIAKGAKNKVLSVGSRNRPEFFETASGIRVTYLERPQSHAMSLYASALGGLRLEVADPIASADADCGTSYLMAQTWTKGTHQHDAKKIAQIIEGSAAGADGFSGRNSVGMSLSGLARDWNKLSNLFSELLIHPTFPESELEHSRRVTEDAIKGVEDSSGQLCSKLFLETLYESHPYGRMSTGTAQSVRGIDAEKVRSFHRRWIRPDRLSLAVVGNVKKAEFQRWLTEFDRELVRFASDHPKSKPEPQVADESPLKAPRWAEKRLGREQVHLLVGNLGISMFNEDRLGLQVLNSILGGQSGRLFIELREKRSLAYTVAPSQFDGMETGYLATYIASAPQKREEAIQGIRAVLENLAEKGPTEKEIDRARQNHLGRRAMDLQSDSSLASTYNLERLYGLPHLSDDEVAEKLKRINAKQLREICRKYWIERETVTCTVG